MTPPLMLLLVALIALEGAGTLTFVLVYMTRSDWRSTRVGRHLAFYGLTLTGVYGVTFAARLWPNNAMAGPLLAVHTAFAIMVWHRVLLVLAEQREEHDMGVRSAVPVTPSRWWLRLDGLNRAWRTVLQGAVAAGLTAGGDVLLQVIMDDALNGRPVDWGQTGTRAAYTGGAAVLMAILAYLHRTRVDPTSVPSAQPPAPQTMPTPDRR